MATNNDDLYAAAIEQHRLGKFAEAEASYRRILSATPTNVSALHRLGVVLHQQGRHTEALGPLEQAVATNPASGVYHNNLGGALLALGRRDAAYDHFIRATELAPDYADAWANVGLVWYERESYDRALAALNRALELNPHHADAHYHVGNTLLAMGRTELAVGALRRAIAANEGHALAHNNLGNALLALDQHAAGLEAYRMAVALDPALAEAQFNLGVLLAENAQTPEADEHFGRAIALRPDKLLWRLRNDLRCPQIAGSTAEVDECLARLESRVDDYRSDCPRFGLDDVVACGCVLPFQLTHFGRLNRTLREKFAALLEPSIPQFDLSQRVPGPARIGLVVTQGHDGIFIRSMTGLLNRLPSDELSITIVCQPSCAERIRKFIQHPKIQYQLIPYRLSLAAREILQAAYDVLYHWEIGSDPFNYLLAAQRLAPVQCTSWGIMETSGLATIDDYLSSDLMELPEAQNHYRERLVRMPTLLCHLPRLEMSAEVKSRDQLGLPERGNVYLCVQQVLKYQPEFDDVLAGILRRDPHGQVVIVQRNRPIHVELLQQRLQRTLPDVYERIVFVPMSKGGDYLHRIAAADVGLDTYPFGAGSSTYDVFSTNSPLVTWPTDQCRARYTLACYRKMGLLDLIAHSADQYADIAVRLATDREWNAQIRTRLSEATDVLFGDQEVVDQFRTYFLEAAGRARRG